VKRNTAAIATLSSVSGAGRMTAPLFIRADAKEKRNERYRRDSADRCGIRSGGTGQQIPGGSMTFTQWLEKHGYAICYLGHDTYGPNWQPVQEPDAATVEEQYWKEELGGEDPVTFPPQPFQVFFGR
jgi:hypothetical protein